MVSAWRIVLASVLVSGCGLERTWDAFQRASEPDSESSDSSSSSSGSEADTDTSGSGTSDTGGDTSDASTGDAASAGETSSTSEPASGSTTQTATSTGSAGVCGDGVVDPEEECDDGNADEADRCTADCRKIRFVFISSDLYQGSLNGLQGADAQCRSSAAKAKMADRTLPTEHPFMFKALLATSTATVFERHFHGKGPYKLINGLRVSDSFDQLFSEPHQNPINVDERSQSQHSPAWTGMDGDGQNFPGIDFCQDWSSTVGTATWGLADAVDGWWLFAEVVGNPPKDCGLGLAIYCLEQE